MAMGKGSFYDGEMLFPAPCHVESMSYYNYHTGRKYIHSIIGWWS